MEVIKFAEKTLELLDQTKLPTEVVFIKCQKYEEVAEAIKKMKVRGAPAIGVAAAYGMVLAGYQFKDLKFNDFKEKIYQAGEELKATRPTAVNLFWAVERMNKVIAQGEEVKKIIANLVQEAKSIQEEDLQMNLKMGRFGAELIPPQANILTHCNAGALATAGFGTALGVIRAAFKQGKVKRVYVDETRPLLQGARLTTYELMEDQIPITLITDNMAAYCMQLGKVDCIIVGADRIASNGDVANKIGTYGLAVLAKAHHIPFYVAAPSSTFDLSLEKGEDIPIEERNGDEIRKIGDAWIAPQEANVFNPAFDVTPHDLVTAIITDKGVIKSNYKENIKRMLNYAD